MKRTARTEQWAGDALLSNQQEVNQGSSGIASRQRQCVKVNEAGRLRDSLISP